MNGGIEPQAQAQAQNELQDNSYSRIEGGPGRRSPSNAAFPHINRHKLAEACNVTDSCIGKVFNRDTLPGLRLAGKIAQVLGVSMEELMTELSGKVQVQGKVGKGKVKKGKGKR